MKHLKMSYNDVLSMATYERRYFLTSYINENQKRQEQAENLGSTTTTGNGKRTTKVSGQALKTQLKNGDIPNQ
jgi:hypothetical protein